ncbi:hypothetical protein ACOSQ3_022809 [Xanthoceras sorbifolium]
MRMPTRTRNMSKFCHYHNEVGHNTSEYYELRDTIEGLIRRGRLGDYMVCPQNQQQPQQPQPLQ